MCPSPWPIGDNLVMFIVMCMKGLVSRLCPPPHTPFPETMEACPGGGGGTQMLFGRGCAAEAAKPVPIFKGHFGGKGYPLLGVGGKGYPLLGVFIQENYVFVYFSDEMGENI